MSGGSSPSSVCVIAPRPSSTRSTTASFSRAPRRLNLRDLGLVAAMPATVQDHRNRLAPASPGELAASGAGGKSALWMFSRTPAVVPDVLRNGGRGARRTGDGDDAGGRPPAWTNRGTTTGPARDGVPRWMCAALGGATLVQKAAKSTVSALMSKRAADRPSASPGPGTRARPWRPPPASRGT